MIGTEQEMAVAIAPCIEECQRAHVSQSISQSIHACIEEGHGAQVSQSIN